MHTVLVVPLLVGFCSSFSDFFPSHAFPSDVDSFVCFFPPKDVDQVDQ